MKYRTFRRLVSATLLAVFVLNATSIAADDLGNTFVDKDTKGVWSVLGPNGGDVRAVAVDPRDANKLYISTMDGQIHVSGDAGKSWKLLASFGRSLLTLDQLFVDSRDSNVIYASGHRGKLAGGFFKSKDGGLTWDENDELKGQAIHAMHQANAIH